MQHNKGIVQQLQIQSIGYTTVYFYD
jgi:hypothetical protein